MTKKEVKTLEFCKKDEDRSSVHRNMFTYQFSSLDVLDVLTEGDRSLLRLIIKDIRHGAINKKGK